MIDAIQFLSFQIHGSATGHKASDGVAGGVEHFLTFIETSVGLSPAEIFTTLMPGFASLANIHPLIVHFPIAFLLAFFILDVIGSVFKNASWRLVATGLLYLGTLSAGLAVLAGLEAASTVEHGNNVHLIILQHKTIGFSILGLASFLSVWRLLSRVNGINGGANFIFLTLAAVLSVLIILGADLGGLLVYQHGISVKAAEVHMMDYFQEHTHSH